jgi:Spy/CpxP family protein refolding chaperone
MSFGIQSTQNLSSSPTTAQTSATNAPAGANAADPFANLDLTAQQQQQFQQIFGNVRNGTLSPSQAQDQINAILTPTQQQTLQNDLQQMRARHHHRHNGGGESATNPLAQLDLTSDQQGPIAQLVQTAQADGTAPSDLVSQIDNVLTPSQQQKLANLLASAAYTSTGASTSSTTPVILNTNA